jgi:hypothetical protein
MSLVSEYYPILLLSCDGSGLTKDSFLVQGARPHVEMFKSL